MTAFEEALNCEENNNNSNSFEVDGSFNRNFFYGKSTNSIRAKITSKHFEIAFSKVKPSISAEVSKYDRQLKISVLSINEPHYKNM